MQELICRLVLEDNTIKPIIQYVDNGRVTATLVTTPTQTLQQLIESDKKFKVLIPRDGKSFAYRLLNTDTEISFKNAKRAIYLALDKWKYCNAALGLNKALKFDFHEAKKNEIPDLTYQFRAISEDPLLDKNTIAYMYFPLGGPNNGVCIINKLFYFDMHGKGVSMHLIDPEHYPDPNTVVKYLDTDLDVVLYHEDGHGVFGLQHTQERGHGMSSNYSYMAEEPTMQDYLRAAAKVGTVLIQLSRWERILKWLRISSEKDR